MTLPTTVGLAPPIDIGREEAGELARRELSKPIYGRDDEPLLQRLWRELWEALDGLVEKASGAVPGGWPAVVFLAATLIGLIIVIRLHTGAATASRRSASGGLFSDQTLSAREHRAAAEQYAAQGQWAEAIRERLRAIARSLEERAIVDPSPGRTADELAAVAGKALPSWASELTAAARLFDDVWYGGRAATAAGYDRLRSLDKHLGGAKPVLAGSAP